MKILSEYLSEPTTEQERKNNANHINTAAEDVKVFDKNSGGSFTETKGELSLAPVLFGRAETLYKSVIQAAQSNAIMPKHEKELAECIAFLSKLIEVDPIRGSGVPNAMRAAMYFISGQLTHSVNQLDKAETDYIKAIAMGDGDPSNLAIWHESLEQVRNVKSKM